MPLNLKTNLKSKQVWISNSQKEVGLSNENQHPEASIQMYLQSNKCLINFQHSNGHHNIWLTLIVAYPHMTLACF